MISKIKQLWQILLVLDADEVDCILERLDKLEASSELYRKKLNISKERIDNMEKNQ